MNTLKSLLLFTFLALGTSAFSQTETITINGNSLEVMAEVLGPMDLLWNTFDYEYRYFVRKDGETIELTNTQLDGKYQQEYRKQLADFTSGASLSTEKLKLTLVGLRRFVNSYNQEVNPNYIANSETTGVKLRLGGFLGVTNSVFTDNPENISNPQFGLELEVLDTKLLKRHALVFQYKQTLSSDDFDYSATQFSINHRFKFLNPTAFAMYVNTKLVTYTYSERGSRTIQGPTDGPVVLPPTSGGALQAPIIFGLGADIRLGKGYLTLNYHDAVALTIDANENFPVDVSIGYKFGI